MRLRAAYATPELVRVSILNRSASLGTGCNGWLISQARQRSRCTLAGSAPAILNGDN
jgi:hypothetical protein